MDLSNYYQGNLNGQKIGKDMLYYILKDSNKHKLLFFASKVRFRGFGATSFFIASGLKL